MGLLLVVLIFIGIITFIIIKKPKIDKKVLFSVLFIFISIAIILLLVKFISNKIVIADVSNIEERQYNQFSHNLYYTMDLLRGNEDKETILKYCKTISEYLSKKYPSVTFYAERYNSFNLDSETVVTNFYIYQLIDMAVFYNSGFTLEIKNGEVDSDEDFSSDFNFVSEDLQENINIDINRAKEIGINLAKEHSNEIFSGNNSGVKCLVGSCFLEYDSKNKFYYTVKLNNGSYVKIDAKTGNVIDTYFFDGIIY